MGSFHETIPQTLITATVLFCVGAMWSTLTAESLGVGVLSLLLSFSLPSSSSSCRIDYLLPHLLLHSWEEAISKSSCLQGCLPFESVSARIVRGGKEGDPREGVPLI